MKTKPSLLHLLAGITAGLLSQTGRRVAAANTLLMPIRDMSRLNDQSLLFGPQPENLAVPNGTVCAANDNNFDAAHLSQPLTDYIVGATEQTDLQALLNVLAPDVPVGRAFTYRKSDDKEFFQSDSVDNADIREIGGEFKQVRVTGEQVDGRTDNKGLTMVLDNDQGGLLPAVQRRAVLNLTQRLLRSELRRVITLLDANDSAENSVNWGPTNTSADPDADILSMLETSGDARAVDSNILVLGGAWVRRVLALRRSDKSGAFATGQMTAEQLADYFNVEKVVVMKARFQSTSAAKAKILTNDVYAYYAAQGMMNDDPSNVKRFVTPTDAGPLKVYIEQRLKKTLVSVEHYSRIVCPSSLGIHKLPTTYT